MNRVLLGVCVALALLSALLWRGRDNARDELADRSRAYVEAQRQAAIKNEAWRVALETRYATQAREVDLAHEAELDRALAAARRYVNRVRTETADSASGGTGTRAESGGAEGAIGPDQASVMVAAEDVEICTMNTIRLESAQEWARGISDSNPH